MVAGNAVYSGAQWAVIAVLSHNLGMEAVGAFGFALSIVAPLIMFGQMQLRAQVAADAGLIRSARADVALRLSASAATVTVAVVVASVLWLLGVIATALALVIGGIALARAVESFSDLSYGYRQHDGQFSIIASSLVLRSILSLIAVIWTVIYTGSVAWSAWVMAVSAISAFLFADADKLRQAWSRRDSNTHSLLARMRRQAMTALPFGVAALITSLHFNLPRLILQPLSGMASVGRLTALLYFLTAMTILSVSVIEASGPALARLLHLADLPRFRREASVLTYGGLAVSAAFALLFAVAGGPLLNLVYGPEALFTRLETSMLSLCVALSIQLTFVQYYLILAGRGSTQIWGAASGSLATVLLSALLIPLSPVAGALTGYACGLALSLTVQVWRLRSCLRIPEARLTAALESNPS